ncbi:S1/P1 nuclease [Pseudomonadota bacterium]
MSTLFKNFHIKILIILASVYSTGAQAWGELGHQLVCDIAWRSMSSDAKRDITKLIRLSSYKTFADACTHADKVRSDPNMAWLKPYHYINIAREENTVKESDCSKKGCVLNGISKYSGVFATNDSPHERLEALMYLGHFVGDIHQPLHVSYSDDLGGNNVSVTFFGKNSNLHQVWDSGMLQHKNGADWRKIGTELFHQYNKDEKEASPLGKPIDWANESFKLTQSAYAELPKNKNIGQSYYKQFYPLITQRIYLAGERLGRLVDELVASRPETFLVSNKSVDLMTKNSKENYYASVSNSLQGKQLHKTLHKLIKKHKQLSYREVWTALEYTDEDLSNTNNVILLYTQRSHPKTDRVKRGSSSNAWNREHVWAKSHGFPNKSDPRYTDIHHLRPTDNKVNSDRGHKDFDIGGSPHPKASGVFWDTDSFEPPNEVKGDVARMMFYMATAYKNSLRLIDSDSDRGTPKFGYLCTLLKWHQDDPVSSWEQRRNNRVHEIQANRNPFIDYPEYVESIWGNACH